MISPTSLRNDLDIVHTDFADPKLRTGAGNPILGFLTEETEMDEAGSTPGLVASNFLMLRSPQRYAPGTLILRGSDRWEVVSVMGDEGAWKHHLRA